MKLKKLFFITLLFCILISCGDKHPTLPNVPVNFYIYPNNIDYINLNYYGGHEYFTGGVNGIIVYRLGEWEFTAFDRACPHDWDDPTAPRVSVEDDGITLRCERCTSLYNILDGGIISGPSKYTLKRYQTNYDGMRLRVHN